MNRQRIILLAAFAVVALSVLPTQAAADITGLTVSPSPVVAGTPVTITVEGTGRWCNFQVDFGDGSTEQGPQEFGVEWPQTLYHTYRLPSGARTITVKGGEGVGVCGNEVSATVTVEPGRITRLYDPPQ